MGAPHHERRDAVIAEEHLWSAGRRGHSLAKDSAPTIFSHFVGNAGPGQAHELGEWGVRPLN